MSKRKRSRDRSSGKQTAAAPHAPATRAPTATVAARGSREERSLEREARARAAARGRRRGRALRWAVGAAAAAGVLAVVLVVAGFGLPEYGRSVPSEGGVGVHIEPGTPLPQRNRPPTSGPHYGSRASYGVSAEPVDPGAWVHALEHGAIVVAFRCDAADECAAIADEVERTVYQPARVGRFDERKIVGTPYQEMDSPFAVLAWGRILELDALDAAQVLAFYDRYLDRGPENAR